MTRGKLHAALDLGPVQASLDAEKRRDSIDFDIALDAASLAPVRPWLPTTLLHRVDLGKTTLALQTHGRAEKLSSASPSLREETKLRLERLAFDRNAAQMHDRMRVGRVPEPQVEGDKGMARRQVGVGVRLLSLGSCRAVRLHRDDQSPARLQNPANFDKRCFRVREVLEDMPNDHFVKERRRIAGIV